MEHVIKQLKQVRTDAVLGKKSIIMRQIERENTINMYQ